MKSHDATGWAMLAGLPSTLLALTVNPPLGLALGAATWAAFKYGRHQEGVEGSDRLAEHVAMAAAIRAEKLAQERAAWDDEFEQLMQMRDSGEFEENLLDELEAELLERYPT